MPLSVKDGMGAWIKDFQKSDAPQFKGKSDKERREMAMAAYLSAKRGDKNEEVKPPFDPDPPSKNKPRTNSDGSKTSPMSRARQLAKMARDRNMKKEDTQLDELSNDTLRSYHAKAATDLKKKKDQVSKGQLTQKDFKKGQNRVTGLNRAANKMESVELEEMYASTTEPHKDGHRPKVVRTQPNGKTTMSYLGQHVYKSKEHARNAADHIAKGMRKGRASDSYIDDFARRHHKEHGMKESTQIDELDTKTYSSYSDKAGKQLMGRDLSPDKRSLRALGRATADMKKYGDKRTLKQRIRQDLNKESVELGEAFDKEKFQSAEAELVKYAKAHGGMDKRDFLEVAKMLGQIGRINILQAGQILARLNRKLSNMDTDPRDKVYSILKQKKLMESVEEAKDSDQKFKDHLKFATSKSPAVQAYMKKRKADRDAAHAKQDPAAVKKNYGPAVVPPGTAYNKARKKGMNPSAAADAVSGAFKNKAKRDRKLPK